MAKKVPTQYRIKKGTLFLLLFFTGIADFIQFALSLLYLTGFLAILGFLISTGITMFVMMGYGLFFLMNGVSPLSGKGAGKKIGAFAGTLLSENIPIISQFMPSLTLWTFFVVRASRKEDEIRAVELAKKAEEDAKIQMATMQAILRRRQMQEEEFRQLEQVAANDAVVAANDNAPRGRAVSTDRRPIANDNRPPIKRKAA